MKTKLLIAALALSFTALGQHSELRYIGRQQSNPDYHHGQLSPAVGVHNIQVMRANRQFPELSDNFGWTYNHASMIAYWNGKLYVSYLSNPVNEHGQPGQTLMLSSADGYAWSRPQVVFPQYELPAGTTYNKDKKTEATTGAIMHQRMGFYVSKSNRLLVLGFYGVCPTQKDKPFDENGIGRVVREQKADGTLGDIYFIRYNQGWDEKNTRYPLYTRSKDKGFVADCNELLGNKLVTQQWVEEANADDPVISLKGADNKAWSIYHLPDGRALGVCKHSRYGITPDEGKTWSELKLGTNIVTWNAKVWGQKTSDGRYAMVYNPSLYRWPLAVMTGEDGLTFDNLLTVHNEISTRRYEGAYKSFGPQYIRGISEGNGTPPDGKMWLTYSMNKEDIWVASVPMPVTGKVEGAVSDVFAQMKDGEELKYWNIYSPLWSPVKVEKNAAGEKVLVLRDRDRYDYAKVERVFPAAKKVKVNLTVTPAQNADGLLHVELLDAKGATCIRLVFDADGTLKHKPRARFTNLLKYEPGKEYAIGIALDTDARRFDLTVNGKEWKGQWCMMPVESVERIMFRTGERRYLPTIDTEEEDGSGDMPQAGLPDKEAAFAIKALQVE